jgi:hypothetical protein
VDPDETLRQLRASIGDYRDATSIAAAADAADRVADCAEALDGWLRGGGFLPVEWSRR